MELELAGKTFLVTGATGLIGSTLVEMLLAEGARVALCSEAYADLTKLQAKVDPSGEHTALVPVDLTEPQAGSRATETALEAFSALDGLVNCVGAAPRGNPFEMSTEAFLSAMSTKFGTQVEASLGVANYFRQHERPGTIVSIVGAAAMDPIPNFLPGGAANAALLHFFKGLSQALQLSGVRVLTISPSMVKSEAEVGGDDNTLITPRDVAEVILFALSGRARRLNGRNLLLDGGLGHGW
jgi:NAD(P)-dependent dehydrogenase (short-subunit alcohol dehydrogenase family)